MTADCRLMHPVADRQHAVDPVSNTRSGDVFSSIMARFWPKFGVKNPRYHANISEGVSFCPPQIVFIGRGERTNAAVRGHSPGLRGSLLTRDAPSLSPAPAQATSPSRRERSPSVSCYTVVECSGLEPVILVSSVPANSAYSACSSSSNGVARRTSPRRGRSDSRPAWQASGSGRCVPDPHPFIMTPECAHHPSPNHPSPITHHPSAITPSPRPHSGVILQTGAGSPRA